MIKSDGWPRRRSRDEASRRTDPADNPSKVGWKTRQRVQQSVVKG